MSRIVGVPKIGMVVTLELTEGEARFLDGLLGYGGRNLIDAAYEKLGRAYIEPFERDGLEFCTTARTQLGMALHKVDRARAAFNADPAAEKASAGSHQEKQG